jgi:HPt (histidine-containing phosphotransfer) domain-containing protein
LYRVDHTQGFFQAMPTPTAPNSTASLDREVLARLRSLAQDTDPTLYAEILGTYRDDVAKYLSEIRQSLADRNAEALHRHAHAMKGASLNTGAVTLAGICAGVEGAAETGDLNAASALVPVLEQEIHRVQADIALELQLPA